MRSKGKIYKKRWYEKRALKIKNKWYSKKKRYCEKIYLEKDEVVNSAHEYVSDIPEIFSFQKNPEETIAFLNRLIRRIEKKILKQKFFINAYKVKEVTTDALIYIIAVIYNMKANRALQYSFRGNLPLAQKPKSVFERSGYLNFFKTKRLVMPECAEYVQIKSGQNVDTGIASEICDFVNRKLETESKFTKILYSTLIELMSNTAKHAYNEHNKMVGCWYIYAVCEESKVSVSFIDTGEGIPKTVKKKITEKINWKITDAELINAAFTEEGRSETGLSYRGRGLPYIYRNVRENKLNDFYVISGSGFCKYNPEKLSIEKKTYLEPIFGTIFQFSICKEEDKK
ncbi:ATP-binding protein [Ruminococcus sp. OM08-7]|nr:ATP-binding protein [Ruminococcus sp. OM08-7]